MNYRSRLIDWPLAIQSHLTHLVFCILGVSNTLFNLSLLTSIVNILAILFFYQSTWEICIFKSFPTTAIMFLDLVYLKLLLKKKKKINTTLLIVRATKLNLQTYSVQGCQLRVGLNFLVHMQKGNHSLVYMENG